jgi:hypothetical protein
MAGGEDASMAGGEDASAHIAATTGAADHRQTTAARIVSQLTAGPLGGGFDISSRSAN